MSDVPSFSSFTRKTVDEVFSAFATSPCGLSGAEVERRLREYGPNAVRMRTSSWLSVLGRQFRSSFVYLLIGAAAVSGILGEWVDAVTILLFIALNTAIGFYQEFRSEHTLKLLERTVAARARIVRDGKETLLTAREIVPGDLVMIETGDIVPADARIVSADRLVIDESILTGESVPVPKTVEALPEAAADIFHAQNIAFSGTSVASGVGRAVVVATGARAVVSTIATAAHEGVRVSSFEKGMNGFSVFVLRLVLVTLAILFLANIFIKGDRTSPGELILFAIALAVSVIPEALPIVTTFSLSRGALRLAKNKVVVRRLSAIEDLGSIEVLCTDKTGTLTENSLTVDAVYGGDERRTLCFAMIGASEFDHEKHDTNNAFDRAVWNSLTHQERQGVKQFTRLEELPFDPHTRRNAVVVEGGETRKLVIRGAPEDVLSVCSPFSVGEQKEFARWAQEAGRTGKRVIGVASKEFSIEKKVDVSAEMRESFFHWEGAIAFADPIKESARTAVQKAQALGVTIKMLTGDSPEVAGSVAYRVGLVDSIDSYMAGKDFFQLSKEKQRKAVETYQVFARVTPEQKLSILETLQEKYEVGFLGEGINDAPALKSANVGIVVDGASDIARDAADIVLLKKGLGVIVDGIHEGRAVFTNTIKYVKATLSSNFGNFYAVAIASLFIDFLPMLPLQILLVNLLSDFPMIAVAADRVDPDELACPRRYDIKEIALLATFLGLVSTVFDFIFFALFYRISPAVLQTNWFLGSILTELVFLFSIRTKFFVFRSRAPSPVLISLTLGAALITILLPFTGIGQHLFHFVPPTPSHLFLILALVVTYFCVTEGVKILYYRSNYYRSLIRLRG